MKFKDIVNSDYFKLFIRREGRIVLGKKLSNVWLLCSVLTVTFLAVAFSNASLDFLSYKMNDPFINWVDIKNNFGESDFKGLSAALQDEELLDQFHARDFQTDKHYYSLFFNETGNTKNLHCRFFADIQTDLVEAIMDEDNLIRGCRINQELLDNTSYGVIITYDALFNKLGYSDIPPFINYCSYTDVEAAEDFCVEMYNEHFAKVPVPVLAVVKRLPTNMDIIGTKFFYLQDKEQALNLYEPSYSSSFIYYLPDKIDKQAFISFLESCSNEKYEDMSYFINEDKDLPRMANFNGGSFVSLIYDYEDDVDFAINREINDEVLAKYASSGVLRVYDFNETEILDDDDDYLSVHFKDLNLIADFQDYVKNEYKIDIEMSQISAKENFNEVSIMANILSWTMIVFAIVCIILFIVNLMQSYFQKVKRNLGTFKAFGINDNDLVLIYLLIMVAMVVASVIISLTVTWFIQIGLGAVGVVKDEAFGYLSLWNPKTVYAIVVILGASLTTIFIVMKNLLKATPGDLIYDR